MHTKMALPRLNSGVYDPAALSPHEHSVLTPEDLETCMESADGIRSLKCKTRILVAGQEFGIFEYLVSTLQIDQCISAAQLRPIVEWLAPSEDASGRHPLHWACIIPGFNDDERINLVSALLEARANPNCRDTDTFGLKVGGIAIRDLSTKCGGKTPLHHLCGSMRENDHSLQAIELLLNHGADPNLEDNDGNTAASLAQMERNRCSAARLGAVELEQTDSAERKAKYARRCTEREEAWDKALREERIRKRMEYLMRLRSEYTPKHPMLYSLCDHDAIFEPSFLAAVRIGTREAFESMKDFRCLRTGLYQYRIFSQDVCGRLMEEVDNFNEFSASTGLPVTRPNSMNRFGLIMNDIGFLNAMNMLMHKFIQPFASAFFSERLGEGFAFRSQHTFVVRYKMGEDLDLKTHRDDSDLTLNVCLGKEFEGATLYFHGDRGSACTCAAAEDGSAAEEFAYPHPQHCRYCTFKYAHTPGVGIMHTGAHVHGAERLTSGERSNLIVWCRTRGYKEELLEELTSSEAASDTEAVRPSGPPAAIV